MMRATLLLAVVVLTPTLVAQDSGTTSSLHPQTVEFLANLPAGDGAAVLKLRAYVSPAAPRSHAGTIRQLRTLLRDIAAQNNLQVVVEVQEVTPYSKAAQQLFAAEGILPFESRSGLPGVLTAEYFYAHVFVEYGAERRVLPVFIGGTAVEYELLQAMRSAAGLAPPQLRIGLLPTLPFQTQLGAPPNAPSDGAALRTYLEQRYEVVDVPLDQPIDAARFDVLFALQPSTLDAESLELVCRAIAAGIPTAVLQDNFPFSMPGLAAALNPESDPLGLAMSEPTSLDPLWNVLGVEAVPSLVVWHDYRPVRDSAVFRQLSPEYVFLSRKMALESGQTVMGGVAPNDPATAGLHTVVLPYPSLLVQRPGSGMKVQPLLTTSASCGAIALELAVQRQQAGSLEVPLESDPRFDQQSQTLAVRILSPVDGAASEPRLHCVLIGDVDFVASSLLQAAETQDLGVPLDNAPFLLNVLETLAGRADDAALRARRLLVPPATEAQQALRAEMEGVAAEHQAKIEQAQQAAQTQFTDTIAALQAKVDAGELTDAEFNAQATGVQRQATTGLQAELSELERARDAALRPYLLNSADPESESTQP
jgi:hypothetical protein